VRKTGLLTFHVFAFRVPGGLASSPQYDPNVLRLLVAQGKVIAAEAELDRVAEGRPADDLDGRAVAESHLEQAAADFGVAADGENHPLAANSKLVETARLGRPTVVTGCKPACLLHINGSGSKLYPRVG